MKALLALEDGTIFSGHTFAGEGEVFGEFVFNISMTAPVPIRSREATDAGS